MPDIISEVFAIIKNRQAEMPKGSYTTKLFKKGEKKICKKLGEEASEVIIAALAEGKQEFIYESADLLYHLFVLMAEQDVTPQEIMQELHSRMEKK